MTKILKVSQQNPEEKVILYAVELLEEGKIIIYPTDTVYGLGCSMGSANIEKVFSIKNRERDRPLSLAFSSIDMAEEYVILEKREREFMEENMGGAFTFVVKKRRSVPGEVTAGKDTLGVRIPDHVVVREIVRRLGTPIITTSANLSGEPSPVTVGEIPDEIKKRVDLIIDSGPCRIGVPSRVVDLVSGGVIRS